MEIRKDLGGKLLISHQLKKNENYKISKGSKFETISIYKKPQLVSGFSNVCEDLKGILVIDYDNTDYSIIEEDYKLIQKMYRLPQAYVFQTKEGNFHVICLYKAPQAKIFEILTHTRADSNFVTMPRRNPFKSYILRLSSKRGSKKPRFYGLIGLRKNYYMPVSRAHFNLLKKLYQGITHPKYHKLDNLSLIKLQLYET